MSKIIRSALVAVAVLGSVSAASARPAHVTYDTATPRSAYDLNTVEGAKAFWESLARSGN